MALTGSAGAIDSLPRRRRYISHATASPPSTSEAISIPKSFQRSRRSCRHSSAKKADTRNA